MSIRIKHEILIIELVLILFSSVSAYSQAEKVPSYGEIQAQFTNIQRNFSLLPNFRSGNIAQLTIEIQDPQVQKMLQLQYMESGRLLTTELQRLREKIKRYLHSGTGSEGEKLSASILGGKIDSILNLYNSLKQTPCILGLQGKVRVLMSSILFGAIQGPYCTQRGEVENILFDFAKVGLEVGKKVSDQNANQAVITALDTFLASVERNINVNADMVQIAMDYSLAEGRKIQGAEMCPKAKYPLECVIFFENLEAIRSGGLNENLNIDGRTMSSIVKEVHAQNKNSFEFIRDRFNIFSAKNEFDRHLPLGTNWKAEAIQSRAQLGFDLQVIGAESLSPEDLQKITKNFLPGIQENIRQAYASVNFFPVAAQKCLPGHSGRAGDLSVEEVGSGQKRFYRVRFSSPEISAIQLLCIRNETKKLIEKSKSAAKETTIQRKLAAQNPQAIVKLKDLVRKTLIRRPLEFGQTLVAYPELAPILCQLILEASTEAATEELNSNQYMLGLSAVGGAALIGAVTLTGPLAIVAAVAGTAVATTEAFIYSYKAGRADKKLWDANSQLMVARLHAMGGESAQYEKEMQRLRSDLQKKLTSYHLNAGVTAVGSLLGITTMSVRLFTTAAKEIKLGVDAASVIDEANAQRSVAEGLIRAAHLTGPEAESVTRGSEKILKLFRGDFSVLHRYLVNLRMNSKNLKRAQHTAGFSHALHQIHQTSNPLEGIWTVTNFVDYTTDIIMNKDIMNFLRVILQTTL